MKLPQDPGRRRALLAGACGFLAVLVLGAVLALRGGGGEDTTSQATGQTPSPEHSMTAVATATATAAPPEDSPAPDPTATTNVRAPTATPQTPTAAPTSVPATPEPQVNLCAGTLQDAIDGAAAGAVLDMSECRFEGTAKVNKSLTLIGGTLVSPSQNNQAVTLSIDANNVTIQGWAFQGGGNVISVVGRTNVRILDNTFRDHSGGVIALWGAVQNIEISGNDILNTRTKKSGIVGGRASEGANPCPTVGRNVTIRNNVGDQGSGDIGWFGIELKCFEDVLIEGNRLRGGSVLISLPDSNRVTIRNNTLDLTGSPYWGVEIPKAHNVTIEYNTVFGDGPQSDTAFSANSGSRGTIVRFNNVQNVRTLMDGPTDAVVTDNCIVNVANVTQHGVPEASTIERNAIC